MSAAHHAHPDAMKPSRPGATRTAPPLAPAQMPFAGRYRSHTLFGMTGVLYLLLGFLALHVVWALGDGAVAWARVQESFRNPIYVAFHALCLVSVIFVGVRFFGLFPASQPPRIGPAKPPPAPVILALLYGAWIVVGGGLAVILAGGIF